MTFKRHYLEDGLTEAHYDHLLPVADPITVLPTTPFTKQQQGSLTITKETQTGTAYQTPPSLAKVFGVLELAEQILLHLPPENLLCKVQRVCRRWHELVRDSVLIQEFLFFKPIPRKTLHHLVTETQPTWDGKHQELVRIKRLYKGTPQHYIENPWLYLFSEATPPTPGSWQRMLVTQPPIHLLKYNTLEDYDELNRQRAQLPPFVRAALEVGFWRVWDSSRDMETRDSSARYRGMKLTEMYIAVGWGTWKALAGWETIASMKKEIRLDEKFLEIEIALELDSE